MNYSNIFNKRFGTFYDVEKELQNLKNDFNFKSDNYNDVQNNASTCGCSSSIKK